MKNIIQIASCFILICLINNTTIGQVQITLPGSGFPNPIQQGEVKARDEIKIQDITDLIPTPGSEVKLFLDKNIQEAVNYQGAVSFSGNNTNAAIDYNLPVGNINGSFSVTPEGQASYDIPIYVPPGTKNLIPSVGISYNSRNPDGIAGRGWSIRGISSITRVARNIYNDGLNLGITLDAIHPYNSDVYALDGNRLIFIAGESHYRLENDNLSKITSDNGSFQLETKEGLIMHYGTTDNSKLEVSINGTTKVLAYYLNKVIDQNNNYMEYIYNNENGEVTLKEIKYTGNTSVGIYPYNSIKFYYDKRIVPTTKYLLNNPLSSTLLLREIEVTVENVSVKRYNFKYGFTKQNFLNEIIESGDDNSQLNSTLFSYGDNYPPSWHASNTPFNIFNNYNYPIDFRVGDFNGDGLSDLLGFNYASINSATGRKNYTGWSLFLNQNIGMSFNLVASQTISNFMPYNYYDYFGFNPQPNLDAIDINADGLDDMVIMQQSGPDNIMMLYLSNGNGFDPPITVTQFTSDSKYTFADINGDRKPELIIFVPGLPGFRVIDPLTTGITLGCPNCYTLPNDGYPITHSSLSVINGLNYGGLSAIDFDGDGSQEIMVSRQNHNVIIKFKIIPALGGNGAIAHIAEIREIHVEPHSQYHQHYYGDYNGDGTTDVARIFYTGSNAAKLKFGTGTTYTSETVISNTPATGKRIKYLTADVNLDGKTDLIAMVYNLSAQTVTFYMVNGDQNSYEQIGQIPNMSFPEIEDVVYESELNPNYTFETTSANIPEFLVGDFNGDGTPDIFFKKGSNNTRVLATLNFNSTNHLLTNITDGFRRNINFKYKTLVSGGSDVYVKGSGATYPLNDFRGAMFVVAETSIPDGEGGIGLNTTYYKYEGAKMHLQGKGSIGFKKVTVSNPLTNRKVTNEYTFDHANPLSESNSYFELLPYKTKISDLINGTLLYEKTTEVSFLNYAYKRHIVKVDEELETDYLTGKNVIKNMTYNSDGILESKIVNVQNGYEITEEYHTIETATNGSWINWKPENIVVKNTRTFPNIEPVYIREIAYEYNSKGEISKKTNDPNIVHPTIKPVVTFYTYDNSSGTGTGALIKEQVNSNGLSSKEIEYFYDNKYRFITKIKNPKGQFSEAAYDPKWGKPKWEKSIDGLITQYYYDGFGRTTKIKTPDNLETNITYNWVQPGEITGGDPVDISHALYSVTSQRSGTPTTRILYDALNRELRSETEGLVNKIYAAKEYDARLRLIKETGNYELNTTSGYVPVVTTYSYNDLDNIVQIKSTDGTHENNTTKSYTYSNGKITVTTVTPDSRTIYKTTDPTGLLIASSDDGGLIQYDYYSNKKLKTVTIGGVEISKIEYDDWARQKNLEDKNTGITTYDYNAYGELIYQIDADNKWYNFSYDELGRLNTKEGIEGTYSYEYVENGFGKNKIKKITGPNYISYSYSYDNLGRVIETDEFVDGQNFITEYQYDQNSNLIKKKFPGNLAIENEYNSKGFHTKIIISGTSDIIWQLDEINPLGQITKYTLGNNIQTVNSFTNFGLPENFVAGNVQNLEMSFNPQNSSLEYRIDHIKNGIRENFEYDPQDRLKKSHVVGLNPHNLTYASNGNITEKTGIGEYTYDGVKVNAVVSVDNAGGLISTDVQDITYTNFKKAATITEGNFEYNLTYGPDYYRKKSQLHNQGTVYTRYYIGDYEKTISGNTTTEVYYLGYGAMYVVENGVGAVYYSYTDHLGSILTVTDASGIVIAEQNFDAWGRKRNPNDWTYDNIPPVPTWLYRGFTGHEHLPEFALINMNGRMYDPLIGRMLSPDNFVQFADYTQNFNRYSYAFNNPLKYTDPSGHTIEKFFRHLINFIAFLPKTIFGPLNRLVDRGQPYAKNYTKWSYLTGKEPLYYASPSIPLEYRGSTEFWGMTNNIFWTWHQAFMLESELNDMADREARRLGLKTPKGGVIFIDPHIRPDTESNTSTYVSTLSTTKDPVFYASADGGPGGDGDYPWYKFFNDGNPGGDFLYQVNKLNPIAIGVNSVHALFTGKDWERGNPMSKTDAGLNLATIVPIFKLGKVINVFGSTGRVVARNLSEQLAMKSIISNPMSGTIIPNMKPLKDLRWEGWRKMEYIHNGLDGSKVIIHYNGKFVNGVLKAVDDFKFK